MAYDGKLLARARNELDKTRAANQAEQQRRRGLVYARLPEVERIDSSLRSQMTELVRLTISRRNDLAERIGALKERNLELQIRRAELLTDYGFGPDYLDDIYCCPLCKDTGLYQGGVCRCLSRLYNQELTKELGTLMRRGDERFEKFDLSLYPDSYDPGSCSIPRETMGLTFAACRRFAENFSPASPTCCYRGAPGWARPFSPPASPGWWRRRASPSAMSLPPPHWRALNWPSSPGIRRRERPQPFARSGCRSAT